jgi:hypothetical protein
VKHRERHEEIRRRREFLHWRHLEWTRRQFSHLADDPEPPDDFPSAQSETDRLAEIHFRQLLHHQRL